MMVNLVIKKIHIDATTNCKLYVSWKRGSKGVYEQSPVVTLGPQRQEVEMNHEISRETVFYTADKGKTFERKTCDFYIYGRNEATKNRVVVIGSA